MKKVGITGQGYSFDFLVPIREMGYDPHTIYSPDELSGTNVEELSGVIIPGGPDVDPSHYGAVWHPSMRLSSPDRTRDLIELQLLEQCKVLGIPVLAVCRGHQIVGVHRGMPLIPDISLAHVRMNSKIGPTGGLYHKINNVSFDGEDLEDRVNTYHHQAVPFLPGRLEECGITVHITADHEKPGDQGIVECMSGDGFFSVQWHPEYDYPQSKISKAVFNKFQEMMNDVA